MATEIEIPAHELEAIHARATLDFSQIKSAFLKGMALTYTYEETLHEITDSVTRKAGSPIHKDLQQAFFALSAHLAVIIEDVAADEINHCEHTSGDIEKLTNIPVWDEDSPGIRLFTFPLEQKIARYEVTGITLSKASVMLTGSCKLSTDEYIEVTTPRIKWEESLYYFLDDLRAAVNTLVEEIKLYKNGKCTTMPHQGDLFEEQLEAA